MYVSEGLGRVLAFDVASGEIRWIHKRTYPEDIRLSMAYPRARGVAVYGDKMYWGTADSFLVALDAQTGKQVWEVRTGDYKKGVGHAHPPLIVDGKVIMGIIGGEREVRGSVAAYEAQSGDLIWKTYTVPEPGAAGFRKLGKERHATPGRRDLGHDQLRSGTWPGLCWNGSAVAMGLDVARQRRCSLHQLRPRSRYQERKNSLVFSDGSFRQLGHGFALMKVRWWICRSTEPRARP